MSEVLILKVHVVLHNLAVHLYALPALPGLFLNKLTGASHANGSLTFLRLYCWAMVLIIGKVKWAEGNTVSLLVFWLTGSGIELKGSSRMSCF